MSATPRIFISYSHDSDGHMGWVAKLATDLRGHGVDVILDQWDLRLGDDLAAFMETSVTSADRVLVVCTDQYILKADHGRGGVGYEQTIVTSELLRSVMTNKFIPVIREVSSRNKVPRCLGSRLYIDFSSDSDYANNLESLLREIHEAPRLPRPPIGVNPFLPDNRLAEQERLLPTGRGLSEHFILQLTAIHRSRKQPGAGRYVAVVDEVYREFEVVHGRYLKTFEDVLRQLKAPQANLLDIIAMLRDEYLFSESQRVKLREYIGAQETAHRDAFDRYLKRIDERPSITDPEFYPNQFFHGIYLYLTAAHEGGFDQRWYSGLIDALCHLVGEAQSLPTAEPRGHERDHSLSIAENLRRQEPTEIDAAIHLVRELVHQLNEWYGKVTHDYHEIMKALNDDSGRSESMTR